MSTSPTDLDQEAMRLIRSGYRPVSNRHRTLSRIDRTDWQERLASALAPWDQEEGAARANAMTGAADFYRRVHSKDRIDVDRRLFDAVKAALRTVDLSLQDGYVELESIPAADAMPKGVTVA